MYNVVAIPASLCDIQMFRDWLTSGALSPFPIPGWFAWLLTPVVSHVPDGCPHGGTRKALIDGPDMGVPRVMMPFKRLRLTDYKVPIQRNARQGTIKKACAVSSTRRGLALGRWVLLHPELL